MRQTLVMFVPILVLLLMSAQWAIRRYRKKRDRGYLVKRCLLTAVVVFYVSYISLTRAAINTFYCVHVSKATGLDEEESGHYWALDTAVNCFQHSHMHLVLFVAIPALLFTLVFPISLAVALINARRTQMLKSAWVLETVGLLFRGFDERFVFWDSVIMLRKALLAAIVVFAYSLGGNLQGLLAGCLLVLALILHMGVCPFKSTFVHLNLLEGISLLVSSFTFFSGVVLNDPMMTSPFVEVLLVTLVMICNVGLTVVLLCMLVHVKGEQIRFSLLSDGVELQLDSGYAVLQAFTTLCMDNVAARFRRILRKRMKTNEAADNTLAAVESEELETQP